MEWLQNEQLGKDKVMELVYNNEMSKNESEILLALAIQERLLMNEKLSKLAHSPETEYKDCLDYFKRCDITLSDYVYEAIHKLDFFINAFENYKDKIYEKTNGEFKEKNYIEKGDTFREVLSKTGFFILSTFCSVDEKTPVIDFKENNKFKIIQVVENLNECKKVIENKIKEYQSE